MTHYIGVVPARSGSKGLPNKNMAMCGGVPLIHWTLHAAKQSEFLSEVFITSDSRDILNYAESQGVDAHLRPDHAATDRATAADVVGEFIGFLKAEGRDLNSISLVYLQPTSPLRTSNHIDACITEMESSGFSSAVSLVDVESKYWKLWEQKGRAVAALFRTHTNANRQQLPSLFLPNGAIYIFQVSDFIRFNSFPNDECFGYVMDSTDSVDIDVYSDLERVEAILDERIYS